MTFKRKPNFKYPNCGPIKAPVKDWSCHAYVPVSELIYAAFRSKGKTETCLTLTNSIYIRLIVAVFIFFPHSTGDCVFLSKGHFNVL
jgi:hypothetical protein